jgi:hypothetical protein
MFIVYIGSPASVKAVTPDFSYGGDRESDSSAVTALADSIHHTFAAAHVSADTTGTAAPLASDTMGGQSESILRLQPGIPETPQPEKKFWFINRKPLALGATLAFSVPIVALEYQWWWGNDNLYPEHTFVYRDDGWFNNYSLGVDKMGHFFTFYVYFHTFYDLMKWADYSDKTAFWVAFAVPAAHAISIEMMDGFAKYGFSSFDLIAGFAGISYAYAQTRVPFLQNFNFKWSYYPTDAYNRPDKDWGLSHDYSGHIYWMSVNMKNVLPKPVADYWPGFINLAVGYGATNVSYGDDPNLAKHKFAIALDYNLSSIPIANDTWAMVVRLFDKFHYPAPGVQIISGEPVKVKGLLKN